MVVVVIVMVNSAGGGDGDCDGGGDGDGRIDDVIVPVRMVRAGLHSFLRMSRQIAPVTELMLGCHIFVSNFILGGTNGYRSGI